MEREKTEMEKKKRRKERKGNWEGERTYKKRRHERMSCKAVDGNISFRYACKGKGQERVWKQF
jgi:hypothetical protein